MHGTTRSKINDASDRPLGYRIKQLNVGLLFLVSISCCIGVAMLYSAANGDMSPWAGKHLQRFLFCLVLVRILAQ